MLADFTACAQPMVDSGADVIVPAGVLPGLLLGGEHGFTVGHASVVNCAAVGLKSAEMCVQLRRLNGLAPSRGPTFALEPRRERVDIRRLHREGCGVVTGTHVTSP
jgi:hypothetical protein